jgi:hypothetical protein
MVRFQNNSLLIPHHSFVYALYTLVELGPFEWLFSRHDKSEYKVYPCATDAGSRVTGVTMATVVLRAASCRTTTRVWIRWRCVPLRVTLAVYFNNTLVLIANGDRMLNVPHLTLEKKNDVYRRTTSQTSVYKWECNQTLKLQFTVTQTR